MTDSVFYQLPQLKTTTLATVGGIDSSQTTSIKLASVTGVTTTVPGIICINWSNPINTTTYEYISYTSIDANNELVGATRGAEDSTGRAHDNGATIAFIVSKSHINEIAKALNGTNTGVTLNTPTLTSPVINTGVSGTAITDEDNMASDSATKVPTQQSVKAYVDSGTVTMTNKRITKRVGTTTSHATPTINTDSYDIYRITAQAEAITSFTTNLSGTPTDGQMLIISITDNGTARAITWGTSFESSGNITLPTTTVISTRLDVGFIYNTVTSKWRCVAVA